MKKLLVVFGIILAFFSFSFPCYAKDDASPSAITIINLVRGNSLGHESNNLTESLKAQWQVTKEVGVTKTAWLFQYGALIDPEMMAVATKDMEGQEFGLMFEISKEQAAHAGIPFRSQGAWYQSDGLFLSSYDQNERKQLIDVAFRKFKDVFGYYPKTIGAWWIDGDSLSYMQTQYGITTVLRAADQFALDFYSIWGTPRNLPYLASLHNAALPASSYRESSKVVILHWAIRDPLEGYQDPLYSLQDYAMKPGYTPAYVDYLASLYLEKPFGNIVIGLENGSTYEVFQKSYRTMLLKAKELEEKGKGTMLFPRDYADAFLHKQQVFAEKPYVLSTDYDSSDQSFSYTSPWYQVLVHKRGDSVYLVDMRDYSKKVPEDFQVLPNSQSHLRIDTPSVIDSMRFPDQTLEIIQSASPLRYEEHDGAVILYTGDTRIAQFQSQECRVFLPYGERIYTFTPWSSEPSLLFLLTGLYTVPFVLWIWSQREKKRAILRYAPLLLPFLFAVPFFSSHETLLLDKKETLLFPLFHLLQGFPVSMGIYILHIVPHGFLLALFFLMVRRNTIVTRILFWFWYSVVLVLFVHVPYFPLDQTTYIPIAGAFVVFGVCVCLCMIFLKLKKKPMHTVLWVGAVGAGCIFLLGIAVLFSRTRYAITSFEMEALRIIRLAQKPVILVEEIDYGIRPIYKAVKPLLYENDRLSSLITGVAWERVQRPENNVLTLSGYEGKYIVIPRYLGTDLSDHEQETLQLKKVFDTAQIAIYER